MDSLAVLLRMESHEVTVVHNGPYALAVVANFSLRFFWKPIAFRRNSIVRRSASGCTAENDGVRLAQH